MKNNHDNIAVIDIGSNSVRLFMFRINGERPEQISAMKFFCGLGRDLGTTGKLNPEAVALTHQHLASFREEIEKYGIEKELVIGTAALREASDADVFVRDAMTRTGFEIDIIEGEEEARLAALAVLAANPSASGIVADFGGGSLELAKIGHGQIEKKLSLRLGAHYLKALPDQIAGIDTELKPALVSHPELQRSERLFIIGGSWRSLAKALLRDQGREGQTLEGYSFRSDEIVDFCAILATKEPKDLISSYQMEAPRAHIMDVSSLMLSRLVLALEPEWVEVSTAGIRDGLAYDYILKHKAF